MNRAHPLRLLPGLFLLGSLFVSAAALSQVRVPTMRVSEVKPGMKGYGLTVFRGETPERFDVEVIDVLHRFRPDQDLILVRTTHPILERAITVGGMSGSPIYLEGKLVGAYAYGWTFGKEPVAGVTPIDNMLAEIGRPIDPRIWKSLGTQPFEDKPKAPAPRLTAQLPSLPPFLGEERATAFSALHAFAERRGEPLAMNDRRARIVQASTPLMLSGMSESAANLLGRELERFGLTAVQAGGGGGARTPSRSAPRFVDGGAIGVQLIRGDINATAIGTVTHVEGNRLVAFGHPMLNAGQIGLPTATARVLHVLSSEMRSFKLGEPVSPLGTLVHDRQAAIVVDQKLTGDMLPLTLRVRGVPEAPRSEWKMEVASNRLLTPSLTFSAIFNALTATAADNTDVAFKIRSRVRIAGHGTVETEDIGYTPMGIGDPVALSRLRLFNVLSAAYGNPFEDTRIEGIDLDIDVRYERDLVTIVDAVVPSEEVDPGKDVNVYVTLRRFDEQEKVKIARVHIPESAAGETVEIQIEAGDDVRLEQPKPKNLSDLLRAVRDGYSGTSLVVSTRLPSQGVRLRGQLVRALPGSALDTLQPVNAADRGAAFSTYARMEIPLGHVVTGSAKLKVNVRQEPLR